MSKDIECPYCEHAFNICHDDGFGYAEDEDHQQECPACEKTFVFQTSIFFFYSPAKADCLNGSPHNMEKTKTWPAEYARMRCKDCGHEKPMPKEPS